MPNRILRDGINDSDAVNSLTLRGEIFYRRLMSFADDYGRAPLNAALLRGKMFALQLDRWSDSDILSSVDECCENGLIICYEVDDHKYIEINKFGQRLRSGSKSKFPDPPSDKPLEAAKGGVSPPISASRARSTTTTHTTTHTTTAADFDFSDWFERQYARHPKKKHKTLAEQAAVEYFAKERFTLSGFELRHAAWCATEDWQWKGGIKAPTLAEWITDEGYLYDPPANGSLHESSPELPGHMNPGLMID